jgi:predicted neuraminidase
MHNTVVIKALLSIGLVSLGLAQVQLPDVAQPGSNGYVKGELIYSLDNRPTPECHASTLCETPQGIVAAWFGGTEERHVDVGIWFARCVDGRWSKAVELVDGSEGEDQDYPCWNPVLFQPTLAKGKTGPLMLFYKVGPTPRNWWGMLITSSDQGHTWTTPRRLGTGPLGPLIGPVKNKPIQLKDGSLLCPSSTEFDGWRVHFERSNDLGRTWEVIGPIHDGKTFGAIQPSVLTYANGHMQILCRSRQNVVSQCWSKDGGNTWGRMTASSLPNPSAGTDAVTLSDGRQLIVYNHTTRKTGARSLLNVALSTNGSDWKPVLTLEKQRGEYSYPAVIQGADGTIHIAYTYRRQSVKYVVLDPDSLRR